MKVAKFEFSLFGINTYVVVDEATRKCAIIDPGMINKEEEDAMKKFVISNNLTVTHIINTHLHIDHAIGNIKAAALFDAPISAHKEDEFLGERMKQQAQMFGISEKVADVSINSYLTDGDIIKIGEGELTVLHVPGHSPGGIALYDKKDGFVISGDSLFAGSIGRTDLPGGDMTTLLNSVKSKLMTLPDSTIVYPGHGPATTIGRERNSNPFLR
ncbi:MAG: MBL fold metallo-hydrolase [Bacteroidales bacterium]|nr:MBL fold metallo-hydrolase [Bacteroidales bacterium]MBD5206163.1 MBL fold metallo-hydrolase [Bacteroidales bacterium]MBD5223533.1 MBL fold metallo-hydrolase [Bacteroidales bacterium]MBD5302507.1 MBL fold metallo-hydrolase [Bacteroides sp.]